MWSEAAFSIADAHLGAAIATADVERISVLTSDPEDLAAVAGETAVTIVPL
jgi:hypothetical protein